MRSGCCGGALHACRSDKRRQQDLSCAMVSALLAAVAEVPDFVLAFNYLAENKALIRYHQGRFFLEVITG